MAGFDHFHYVPVLKAKQGELKALAEAGGSVREGMTPLLEMPVIDWDYENEQPAKSLGDHTRPLGGKVARAWSHGGGGIFIDAGILDEQLPDGSSPLAQVMADLRAEDVEAVPVFGPERSGGYIAAVEEAMSSDERGACLRVDSENASDPDTLEGIVQSTLDLVSVEPSDLDLVLDLGAIGTAAGALWRTAVEQLISRVPRIDEWRSFTLAATSFPDDMSGVPRNGTQLLPRVEWSTWTALLDRSVARLPSFGDYAIASPYQLDIDPRVMSMSASIRYTTDDDWLLVKGASIRDNGWEQTQDLAAVLVARPEYRGRIFSWGDGYIHDRASGVNGVGNGMTWRAVGNSQHFAQAVNQLAIRRGA